MDAGGPLDCASAGRATPHDHARCWRLECHDGVDHQTATPATGARVTGAMEQKRGVIIYDFDGVIADSEVLANAELADIVTELGIPTTLEDSYRLYMGKRFADVIAAIETSAGTSLPD